METMESVEARVDKKRYWVGWTSRKESVETPFPKWKVKASRMGRAEPGAALLYSYAAVIDAADREKAWHAVAERYPDANELYVRQKDSSFWPPRDRFPPPSYEFRAQVEELVNPEPPPEAS